MNARLQHEINMSMKNPVEAQRDSHLEEGEVSASTGFDRIDRAIDVLVRHSETPSEALKSLVTRLTRILAVDHNRSTLSRQTQL